MAVKNNNKSMLLTHELKVAYNDSEIYVDTNGNIIYHGKQIGKCRLDNTFYDDSKFLGFAIISLVDSYISSILNRG